MPFIRNFSFFLIILVSQASANEFPLASSDFDNYIRQVESYLIANRIRSRSEAETRLNLPFELTAATDTPYQGKFLLIHGLNDSAYVWTDMAKQLASRGFDVRAILLSGHGSHPANMLDVSYKEWLQSVRSHYANWNQDDTPIYVGGFSMGAVLATALALENPEIAGLLLISPAYHSRLNSLLRWAWLYAWFKPWMFGGLILEDNPIKYNSIPINSGTQYYRSTVYLKDQLRQDKNIWHGEALPMPVVMAVTVNDSVVDVDYSRHVFEQHFRNPASSLVIYQPNRGQPKAREIIRNSHFPDRRILNLSHLSLLNAPDNPLFGENGNILVCNGNEYPVFMACMRSSEHWFGAQHTPSPDGVAVARSTYNPDFDFLIEVIDKTFVTQGN
ncbi:MAG: alpha/beta fold hydrolase [Pseudomonadota bacterium]